MASREGAGTSSSTGFMAYKASINDKNLDSPSISTRGDRFAFDSHHLLFTLAEEFTSFGRNTMESCGTFIDILLSCKGNCLELIDVETFGKVSQSGNEKWRRLKNSSLKNSEYLCLAKERNAVLKTFPIYSNIFLQIH